MPFRLDLTVWALRRRQDNIVDRWDGRTYSRVLVLEDRPVKIELEQTGSPPEPELHIIATGEKIASGAEIAATAERMLGTRVDLTGFYQLAIHDAQLMPLAQQFRGLKPPRFPSLFEALVNGIACQQLTLTLGIHLLNRLTTTCGKTIEMEGEIAYAFPGPLELAELEPEALRKLGFSRQKARALLELARMVAYEHIDLEKISEMDDGSALRRLCKLRGVGRWTAEYVLLRGMGRLNIFPGDDVGARNKLRHWLGLGEALDYESVNRILARWKPYGGFIYFHLLLKDLYEKGNLL